MVRREGLEPPTYWFVASHSIQLSYRRISGKRKTLPTSTYFSTPFSKMQAKFENLLKNFIIFKNTAKTGYLEAECINALSSFRYSKRSCS